MKKRLDKAIGNRGMIFSFAFIFAYIMNDSIPYWLDLLQKSDYNEFDRIDIYFYAIVDLLFVMLLWTAIWYSSPRMTIRGVGKITFFGIPKFTRWDDIIRVVDKVPTDNLNDHGGTIKFYTTKYKNPIMLNKIIFNEQNIDMHDIIASKLPDGIIVEPETSKTNQLYQAYQEEKKAIIK